MGESIKELKQKIEQLEHENLCLRQLLDEAGISYSRKINADSQDESKQENMN